MSGARSRRLADESGFTLVELLTAVVIGMVVVLAAFMLLDRSVASSSQIAMREETLQRGRQAMEQITRQLRSQVCLNVDTLPIVQGSAQELTLYVDLDDGSRPPERRRLRFDPTANTVTESRWESEVTPPAYPTLETSRVVATGVTLDGAESFFRYYAFPAIPGDELVELVPPLTAATSATVVRIDVSFVTLPDHPRPQARLGTTLKDSIFVRTADTAKQQGGARCR